MLDIHATVEHDEDPAGAVRASGALVRNVAAKWGVAYIPKRVFGRRIWIPLHFAALRPGTVFSRENDYFMALLGEIERSDTVLDVGANFGAFTIAAAATGRFVHAIEPIARICSRLEATVSRNKARNVDIRQLALGSVEGNVQIIDQGTKSRIAATPTTHAVSRTVRLAPLDALDLRFEIAKIDVEGTEIDVLRGGRQSLRQCRAIGVEVHSMAGVTEMAVTREMAEIFGREISPTRYLRGGTRPFQLLYRTSV